MTDEEMRRSNDHIVSKIYLDDNFHVVDKSIATWWRGLELDATGKIIGECEGFIEHVAVSGLNLK